MGAYLRALVSEHIAIATSFHAGDGSELLNQLSVHSKSEERALSAAYAACGLLAVGLAR